MAQTLKERIAELVNHGLDSKEMLDYLKYVSKARLVKIISDDIRQVEEPVKMRVLEVGGIIEIWVPNKKVNTYNTITGLLNYVQSVHCSFVQRVQKLGEYEVVNNSYGYDMPVEINDFGYAGHNKCKKSKTGKVFRSFGTSFYVSVPYEMDMNKLFKTWKFEYKGCEVRIDVASLKGSHNQDVDPKNPIVYKGEVKGRK